jgi:hypothetical protein
VYVFSSGEAGFVDPKYLDDIRAAAKQFSTKRLSRKSSIAECAIRNFKKRKKYDQASHPQKADKDDP